MSAVGLSFWYFGLAVPLFKTRCAFKQLCRFGLESCFNTALIFLLLVANFSMRRAILTIKIIVIIWKEKNKINFAHQK